MYDSVTERIQADIVTRKNPDQNIEWWLITKLLTALSSFIFVSPLWVWPPGAEMKRRRRKKTGTYELIYVTYVLVVLLFFVSFIR